MKDLHEYLDSITEEELIELEEILNKQTTLQEALTILNLMKEIWKAETGNELPDGEEELKKIFESFSMKVSLYHNVRIYHMTCTGRIAINNDDVSFKLTQRGIDHVEKDLLKNSHR